MHAGGGVFAGATRGDGIWMFSLRGTMNSLPDRGGGGGAFGGGPGPPGPAAPAARAPDAARGAEIYREACIACHGEAGDGGHGGGPSLVAGLDRESIQAIAGAGQNSMPGFARVYSAAELGDVAHYIVEGLGTAQ